MPAAGDVPDDRRGDDSDAEARTMEGADGLRTETRGRRESAGAPDDRPRRRRFGAAGRSTTYDAAAS